jgi:putative acyl-CoA dehydrogenase
LLEDYSRRRVAFGKPLAAHPLHRRLLAQLHCLHLAGLLLTLELADLLGREEAGEASDVDRIVLRVMIPVCKIETAKAAVRIASEVVEGFGGAGYIEDVGIARRLRDAQVFSIWEGPSNVLALDMLRALRGGQGLAAIVGDCRARCSVEAPGLERARQRMRLHIDALSAKGQALLEAGEAQARDLAGHLAALYGAALAYSWAAGDERNRAALAPFVDALADLVPPLGAENAVNWAALEEAGAYSPATTSSSGKSSTVS